MTGLKTVVAWGVVLVGGHFAAQALGELLSVEVNSVALTSMGVVAALINAASFQVLRRFDDPPVKNLSQRGAERVDRVFERRRRTFRFKWAIAVIVGIVAAVCGGFLRLSSLQTRFHVILEVGYISLTLTLTLGVLIALEYSALSKIARELPRRLEEQRRKNELLQRLEPPSQEKNLPETPDAGLPKG